MRPGWLILKASLIWPFTAPERHSRTAPGQGDRATARGEAAVAEGLRSPACLASVAKSSYDDDMTTTDVEWSELLEQVNNATKALQRSATVPDAVAQLVDSFDPALHASAPMQLRADPYLATALFAAAFRAEKALRHDDPEAQRRDLRVALEQFRQALRGIVSNRPVSADAPVRDVLAHTVAALSVPQKDIAELLGVSTRQLQRWLAKDGPQPTGGDEARIRIVGQIVDQLRHSFTGPGVLAWFYREHPVLHVVPVKWLDDPLSYPELVGAATAARAMVG